MVRRADADLDAVREQLAQLTAAVHDGNVQPEQILPQEHEVAVGIQKAIQEKYEAMEARLIALEAERKQSGELGGSRGSTVRDAGDHPPRILIVARSSATTSTRRSRAAPAAPSSSPPASGSTAGCSTTPPGVGARRWG